MVVLETLDLSSNLLTEMEFNNAIWPSITTIHLDNNHLTFIKPDLRVLGKVLIGVQGNHFERHLSIWNIYNHILHKEAHLAWISKVSNYSFLFYPPIKN